MPLVYFVLRLLTARDKAAKKDNKRQVVDQAQRAQVTATESILFSILCNNIAFLASVLVLGLIVFARLATP